MKNLLFAILFLISTTAVAVCPLEEPPPPPPSDLPSWISSAQEKTWVSVGDVFDSVDPVLNFPDWSFGGGATYHRAVIKNWNGAVARNDYLVIPFSGGHWGSSQNTVYEFGPFSSENPNWHWYGTDPTKYDVPTHVGEPAQTISDWAIEENVPYYSDGLPSARHTYSHIAYGNGMVFTPFGKGLYGDGQYSSLEAASFKFTGHTDVGGSYEPRYTYQDWPGRVGPGGGVGFDSTTNLFWIATTSRADALYSFDSITNVYTKHSVGSPAEGNDTEGFALDPERGIIILHSSGDRLVIWDISEGHEGEFVEIFNYSGSLFVSGEIGLEYEPTGKKFVGYNGGAILHTLEPPADYRDAQGNLNPNAIWEWLEVANGIGGITPSVASQNGIYGRFRYIPSINAFAVINTSSDPVFVYRIPVDGL
jgi:hypothetical protein